MLGKLSSMSKLCCLLLFCGLAFACSLGRSNPQSQEIKTKLVVPAQPSLQRISTDSIRSVDFSNLAFPNYRTADGRKVTLKPGEAAPAHINYGDVTGDGIDEAIVVLPIETRGTAIPHHVYIYTMKEGSPSLLWDFETCDRADGGLRQVYARSGELIIELYGRGKVLGTNICADDGTRKEHPYPYAVTASHFVWRQGEFKQVGKAEIFYDPNGYGSPIMPLYKRQRN